MNRKGHHHQKRGRLPKKKEKHATQFCGSVECGGSRSGPTGACTRRQMRAPISLQKTHRDAPSGPSSVRHDGPTSEGSYCHVWCEREFRLFGAIFHFCFRFFPFLLIFYYLFSGFRVTEQQRSTRCRLISSPS